VKSLTPSFWPILVWPLPSAPWHLAQSESQFVFPSAAEAVIAAAKPNVAVIRINFFIVRFDVGWCMAGAVLRLANRKIVESQETSQPCFGETLTVFEFMSRI
jgi:hypothetical protein